jgi:phosphopantothenoylcysteine decarboxylase / phosphopantothenate---cysteine ligase
MRKRIILGITGSAAAFKGAALASLLRKKGLDVDGVLTRAACEFITPTQLACVTGRPVRTELFTEQPSDPVPHITLTEGCSLLVVAPATADFMAKAAHGLADDLLSSVFLACEAPVVLAPSMNTRMWLNVATRANAAILRERGIGLAGPVEGMLACGTTGEGRLMEPEDILAVCLEVLGADR